jgi:hypothetical protein
MDLNPVFVSSGASKSATLESKQVKRIAGRIIKK